MILAALGAANGGGPPALEPTYVVREGAEFLPLRVPPDHSGSSIKLEFQWEDGSLEHHWFFLPELPQLESGEKRIPLPRNLRLGYHRLRVYWMRQPELDVLGEAHFIVCPARAKDPPGRVAGIAISLYGLRSGRNWGCGDITDLCAAIDSFARAGASFVALNPLHAIPNRQPYNTSPYLPLCTFYKNLIYLDIEAIEDFAASRWARALAASRRVQAEIEALREAEYVE